MRRPAKYKAIKSAGNSESRNRLSASLCFNFFYSSSNWDITSASLLKYGFSFCFLQRQFRVDRKQRRFLNRIKLTGEHIFHPTSKGSDLSGERNGSKLGISVGAGLSA